MLLYLLEYLITGLIIGIIMIDEYLSDLVNTSNETDVELYWYIIVITLLHVLLWPVTVIGSILDIIRYFSNKE